MHNKRLLIADSDPDMAAIYDRFFGQDGYDVVTVVDGLECMTGLRDFAPKVLVVEHELPWGGGDGVVDLMRADCRLSRVPVVIVYGSASFNYSSELTHPPVVAHLRKPFKLSTLSERIRAAYGADDRAAQH